MNFKNMYKISLKILTARESVCFRPASYLYFSHRLLSTKPIELSYFEFPPDKLHNPTPVIILHGFLGSKQNWRGLGKAIAKKSGRRVFVLDARNHGDSPHSDSFSYSLMSEDVKYFLNSHGIKKAAVVGHSMGGRTAMKLALMEKEMVSKLVAVDVSPTNLPDSSLSAIPSYMKAMKEALASISPGEGIVHVRKFIDEYLSKTIPEAPIRHFLLTNLIEKDKKIMWRPNIDVLQRTFKSEIRDVSDFTGCFMEETLFICGEKSDYVKEDDYPLIKQVFPKAEFIVVPGAGHWVHSEKPVEFLDALCNFL